MPSLNCVFFYLVINILEQLDGCWFFDNKENNSSSYFKLASVFFVLNRENSLAIEFDFQSLHKCVASLYLRGKRKERLIKISSLVFIPNFGAQRAADKISNRLMCGRNITKAMFLSSVDGVSEVGAAPDKNKEKG